MIHPVSIQAFDTQTQGNPPLLNELSLNNRYFRDNRGKIYSADSYFLGKTFCGIIDGLKIYFWI